MYFIIIIFLTDIGFLVEKKNRQTIIKIQMMR